MHKAAREMVGQTDVEHDQALMEKEHRAAKVCERDKLAQARLEQYEEDQEVLRRICDNISSH